MNNLESLATEIGKDIKDIRTRFATKEEMHEATEIDYSQIVTHEQLENKHYLTQHQELTHLATTSDLEVLKNISVNKAELSKKVDTTEYNVFKENTVHIVDVIRNRLSSAEKALFAQQPNPTLSLNDNTLSISGGNSVTLPTHQSEIRGTGMPNGVVEAPIGTTYIDTAKTKGALKWIKTTDGGNQGWKVTEGDTGWVLGWHEDNGNNKNRMYFRRKNDVVHVKFEPKITNSTISPSVNLILEIAGFDSEDNLSIDGFKPVDDVVQTIFNTSGDIYSATSGAENSEGAQGTGAVILKYEYYRTEKSGLKLQIVTSQLGVKENHVNPFSYLTEDTWPTSLP